jgi:hypothetical protein
LVCVFYFSFGMLGWASRNSAIKVSIDWLALHETLLPSGVNFTGLGRTFDKTCLTARGHANRPKRIMIYEPNGCERPAYQWPVCAP